MCPGIQARDECAGCIYLLKETDAPAVVDIRQAAPLVSQRAAWGKANESRIADTAKGRRVEN